MNRQHVCGGMLMDLIFDNKENKRQYLRILSFVYNIVDNKLKTV